MAKDRQKRFNVAKIINRFPFEITEYIIKSRRRALFKFLIYYLLYHFVGSIEI